MSDAFVIQWRSMVNGRAGRGTRKFSREEGEQLVEELNREYPRIRHELITAPAALPETGEERAKAQESEEAGEEEVNEVETAFGR